VEELTKNQGRLLSAIELEMVTQTYSRFVGLMSREQLMTLGRRLRMARDRSRRFTNRNKKESSGSMPTLDSVESARKTAVFVGALKRVAGALRNQVASTSALRSGPNATGDDVAV
jgi:hypothetical protein